MPPSVPPLPAALQAALRPFRFRFHADTWPVFLCLLTGHTTLACVRASLLSAGVTWRQRGDCFRRARWSRTAFMRATTALVLRALYPDGLPARLWWAVDTTTSDTPAARQVCGIRLCRRGCRRLGQTRTHQGHGWLLLAGVAHRRPPVAPVALCPTRPARHRAGGPVGPPAPAHPQRGQRPRPQQPAAGARAAGAGRPQRHPPHAPRRGLHPGVPVGDAPPRSPAPWYLQATDPTRTTAAIVVGDHGRHASEPARPGGTRQANALGLDRYHGRAQRGVRRWPLLLCLAHSLLALLALGALRLDLPELGRPWYPRADAVGQPRRRLLAALARAGIFVPEGGTGQGPPKIARAA